MKERLCTRSAPWTAWQPPRYEGQGRNSGLWTCSLVQPRQIAWDDRVTCWLLKRVDCSSIALSCLFNNYPDSRLFSWCMLVCWCRSLHSFAMSCFSVSQSRFRSRIPRSASLGTSQPHPNASCDTVSHENCGTSEMAVSGGALDTQVRSFQEEGWCQGWFAVELITFCAWTWPHNAKSEPPKNGFKDSYRIIYIYNIYIDSCRFIEYSQRAYVTSILAVKDGMCWSRLSQSGCRQSGHQAAWGTCC